MYNVSNTGRLLNDCSIVGSNYALYGAQDDWECP